MDARDNVSRYLGLDTLNIYHHHLQDGNTPLHAAALNKPAKAGVIQSLLKHGAHFDLVNNDKRTWTNLLKGTPLHEVRSLDLS